MQNKVSKEQFIAASSYTDMVDHKKLEFILAAIEEYARNRNRKVEDLRILEVACGRGGITLPLAVLGAEVQAFDIDSKAVEFLKNEARRRALSNLKVSVEDGYAFHDEKGYDLVIASEVFEHVLEPSRFAESLSRSMIEGAYLIVTTPNGYGPWELKNRVNPRTYIRRCNVLRKRLGKPPYIKGGGDEHNQFYTRRRLVRLFEAISFRLVHDANSDFITSLFFPLRKASAIAKLDLRLADTLPYWCASGWYFAFEWQGKR